MVYVEVSVGNSVSERQCCAMDRTVNRLCGLLYSPESYDTPPILGTEILNLCMFLQYISLYELKWGIFLAE